MSYKELNKQDKEGLKKLKRYFPVCKVYFNDFFNNTEAAVYRGKKSIPLVIYGKGCLLHNNEYMSYENVSKNFNSIHEDFVKYIEQWKYQTKSRFSYYCKHLGVK